MFFKKKINQPESVRLVLFAKERRSNTYVFDKHYTNNATLMHWAWTDLFISPVLTILHSHNVMSHNSLGLANRWRIVKS